MQRTSLIGLTLSLALLMPAGSPARAQGPAADIVFEWNQILQDTLPIPHNVLTPRFFALTHIAMFDAIATFDRDFEPYHVKLRHWNGGSPAAAAAQAAHDVIVALNPAAAGTYDAALASQLGSSPSGFVRHGAEVGAEVARQILSWRQDDGWVVSPFPPYSEPPFPGLWQRTPPANAAPAFTHVGSARPLALLTATQYLPPPPPALTSERYAADLNQVKQLGKSDSVVRTPEQTAIARLWNGTAVSGTGTATNYASIWNTIARDAAMARGLSHWRRRRIINGSATAIPGPTPAAWAPIRRPRSSPPSSRCRRWRPSSGQRPGRWLRPERPFPACSTLASC